jgi:hypothetical protein
VFAFIFFARDTELDKTSPTSSFLVRYWIIIDALIGISSCSYYFGHYWINHTKERKMKKKREISYTLSVNSFAASPDKVIK